MRTTNSQQEVSAFRFDSVSTGRAVLMALILWSGLSGCQSTPKLANFLGRDKYLTASAEHPVVEIICVWEPGEGRGLDGIPTRGFAGQILFFAAGSKLPARVNGDVAIYVFDDQGEESEHSKPLHKFEFDGQVWRSFMSDTNLGPAYQIFIPYTRQGGHQAECALSVKFTPNDGSAEAYSKMANVILRGSKNDRSLAKSGSAKEGAKEGPVANAQQLQSDLLEDKRTDSEGRHAARSLLLDEKTRRAPSNYGVAAREMEEQLKAEMTAPDLSKLKGLLDTLSPNEEPQPTVRRLRLNSNPSQDNNENEEQPDRETNSEKKFPKLTAENRDDEPEWASTGREKSRETN